MARIYGHHIVTTICAISIDVDQVGLVPPHAYRITNDRCRGIVRSRHFDTYSLYYPRLTLPTILTAPSPIGATDDRMPNQ